MYGGLKYTPSIVARYNWLYCSLAVRGLRRHSADEKIFWVNVCYVTSCLNIFQLVLML